MKLAIDTAELTTAALDALAALADWLHDHDTVVYSVGVVFIGATFVRAYDNAMKKIIDRRVDDAVANKTRVLAQGIADLWAMRRSDAEFFDAHVYASNQRNAARRKKAQLANLKQNKAKASPPMPDVNDGEQL